MKNNKNTRLIPIIVLLLGIFVLFTACGNDFGNPQNGTSGDEATSDQATDEAPETPLSIIENGTALYTICRSDRLTSDDPVVKACVKLRQAIHEKTGVNLSIADDFVKRGAAAPKFEIIIGDCNREETKALKEDLKYANFVICFKNDKLIILGGGNESTIDAVNYFISNHIATLENETKTLSLLASKVNYRYTNDFRINSISILGTPISEYSIVIPQKYNASEMRTAEILRHHIRENEGSSLNLVLQKSTSTEHEIRIGGSAGKSVSGQAFSVSMNGKILELTAASPYAYDALQDYLINTLFAAETKDIEIKADTAYSGDVASTLKNGTEYVLKRDGDFRVMFHNIYGNSSEDQPRLQRQLMEFELFMQYLPDVIGCQEFNAASRSGYYGLASRLLGTGIYADALSSSSNITPIFYRSDKFNLIKADYKIYDDGKGDKSKSYTWAVLEDKTSKKRIAVLSTHYWWKSIDQTDTQARLKDAERMLEAVKYIEDTYGVPVICGGDYNCNKSSAPYNTIKQAGLLDASYSAEKASRYRSHHAYAEYNQSINIYEKPVMPDANSVEKSIDHILIKASDKLDIKYYGVVTDLYALLSSDHCPIFIDFNIK